MIHTYCRQDVIQTYGLFLRIELMRGRLTRGVSSGLGAPRFAKSSARRLGEPRQWRIAWTRRKCRRGRKGHSRHQNHDDD